MPRHFFALRILSMVAFAGLQLSAANAQPPSNDPLRGPEVRDRQVPGVDGSFGEPAGDKKRLVNETRLPPRVFRNAMQTILDPDAPANIRVTDEQRTRYQGWLDDFQKTVADYMKQHRQELADLRAKGGDTGQLRRQGGPGGGPAPAAIDDSSMKPDDVANARARFQEVINGAPKVEDLYTKIWSELNPDQQRAVDGKIADFRAEEVRRREDQYVAQRAKKKGTGANPPAADQRVDGAPRPPLGGDSGPAKALSPIDPDRRERLLRMFADLTPEQQDVVLQRLERFRSEGVAGNGGPAPLRRGRFAPAGPGEPKPAPQGDDSMTPPAPPAPPSPTPASNGAGNQP